MRGMLTLLLTRHGHSLAGEVVLGGQLDVALSPRGCAEADALRARLEGIAIHRIISSPMLRALETAQAVASGRPVEVDDRLRELDYGRWEGLTEDEIRARDPEMRARWEDDPADVPPPGGEAGRDVAVRVRSFLHDLLAAEAHLGPAEGRPRRWTGTSGSTASGTGVSNHGATMPASPGSTTSATGAGGPGPGGLDRTVLVVAHGTLNRILLCVAMAQPVSEYRRRFVQDRAGLTVLRYGPGSAPDEAQLALANDLGHLRSLNEAPWG
jgi:broad specificity phosphatase PhoE